MPLPAVPCPTCREPLPPGALTANTWAACPACDALVRVEVFPALLRPPAAGRAAEAILLDGEAGCFYHPEKKAEVPCAECGRFLCALCDVELHGRHLCPACLESGARKGRLIELEPHRLRYDKLALALALLPLILWPFTLLTAPAAIAFAFYGARQPRSLVSRYWIQAGVAVGLSGVQLLGWAIGLYVVLSTA